MTVYVCVRPFYVAVLCRFSARTLSSSHLLNDDNGVLYVTSSH